MDKDRVKMAWFGLDDLFEEPESRDLLLACLNDETGVSLLYTAVEFGVVSPTNLAEECLWLGKDFYTFLLTSVGHGLRGLDEAKIEKLLTHGVKKLIMNDAELRRSFTLEECRRFVAFIVRGEKTLSMLDELTGLYLTLKVLEIHRKGFNVEELIDAIPEVS